MSTLQKNGIILVLIALYLLLILSPIINMFWHSFVVKGEFTIEVYKSLLQDNRIWKIFFRTVIIALSSAFLTTLVGLLLAFSLEKTILPFKKILKSIYLIPLIIPSYFIAFGWTSLLNHIHLGFNIYNIPGIIFIMLLSYFPLTTLVLIAGFRNIDYSLEETAKLITNKTRYFKKIVLPLLIPYILTSMILIFILCFSEYAMPELLRINTYATETLIQFSAFHDFKKAVATSLPPLIITLFLVLIMGKIMSYKPYVTIGGNYKSGKPEKLGIFTFPAFLFIVSLLFLSIICPIGSLISVVGGWENYVSTFADSKTEILYSLFLSFAAATVGCFFCIIIAYVLERSQGILKQILNISTLLPFAIPGTVIGIGLIKLWNRPSTIMVYSSFTCLLLGYLIRFNPYGIRIISSCIKSISKSLEDSANLTPVSKFLSFYKIIFPLLSPFLVITWIVLFIFCMRELPVTLLVIPPGTLTLPIKMESILHIGSEQTIAAICLVYISVIFTILIFLLPFSKLKDFNYA